jgi:hypothetical protein
LSFRSLAGKHALFLKLISWARSCRPNGSICSCCRVRGVLHTEPLQALQALCVLHGVHSTMTAIRAF